MKTPEEVQAKYQEMADEFEAIKGKVTIDSVTKKANLVGMMKAFAWVLEEKF